MTASEFARLPDAHGQRELIRGEVVETMPPGGRHGLIALQIGRLLANWADAQQRGRVGVESGFRLAQDPDTVRAPDVYFISQDRIAAAPAPDSFWSVPPDLAVEVVSPGDAAEDILDKVHDFLNAGTSVVWVVYPKSQTVVAHIADGSSRAFTRDMLLSQPDLLPDFSCRVGDLFG